MKPRVPSSTPTAGWSTQTAASARSSTPSASVPSRATTERGGHARTTRNGWYWSGDLGYVDEEGWVYFAGRTSDWLRVDGENFPAAPIEAIIGRHPDVVLASVYGVPDPDSGDQVMCALVLREGADLRRCLVRLLARRPGRPQPQVAARGSSVSPQALPTTPTNKILARTLVHEKFRSDRVAGDPVYVRDRNSAAFRPFTQRDESDLRDVFESNGRGAAWDL